MDANDDDDPFGDDDADDAKRPSTSDDDDSYQDAPEDCRYTIPRPPDAHDVMDAFCNEWHQLSPEVRLPAALYRQVRVDLSTEKQILAQAQTDARAAIGRGERSGRYLTNYDKSRLEIASNIARYIAKSMEEDTRRKTRKPALSLNHMKSYPRQCRRLTTTPCHTIKISLMPTLIGTRNAMPSAKRITTPIIMVTLGMSHSRGYHKQPHPKPPTVSRAMIDSSAALHRQCLQWMIVMLRLIPKVAPTIT